jgi:hypothetical protein
MSMVDSNGRLFGRINLVDAAALLFALFLIPVGYATYLLFRPANPSIDSVTNVEITREERRIGGGALVMAKLKVKGSGFNPLLRARIGDAEALGFVFENPNSADVIVGVIPAGKHDLVLYDGVQEVARAPGAVQLRSSEGPWVRASGWLANLDADQVARLSPQFESDTQASNAFRVLAVGPVQPARTRIGKGAVVADLPVSDRSERRAELMVRCDWPAAGACAINGQPLTQELPITVTLPGDIPFQIEEVGPPAPPTPVVARVQFSGPLTLMKAGDRDALASSRAAEIVSTTGGVNPAATLRLGADQSREGWRYRGRLLSPGAPFTFHTAGYVAGGTVLSVAAELTPARP